MEHMWVCVYILNILKESVRIWVENRESCGRVYLFELSRTLKNYIYPLQFKGGSVVCNILNILFSLKNCF